MQDHHEHLEKSLTAVRTDLIAAKDLNTSLTFELQNTSIDESDNNMEVSELLVINKHLKDKNDELIMQLQSLTNIEDDDCGEPLNYTCGHSNDDFNHQISLLTKPESLRQECECCEIHSFNMCG